MDHSFSLALKTAPLVAALLAVVAAAYLIGHQRPSPMNEVITLTGTGEVTVVPDRATVTLGVQVTRKDARSAMDEANKLQTKVIAALTKNGVEKADIRTSGLDLQPQYDYVKDQGQVLRGYRVTQRVRVTIMDLGKAGEVLAATAEAAGDAARIDDFKLVAGDRDKALREARVEAIKDARAKAEQFAGAAGRSLGKALVIKETSSRVSRPAAYAIESSANLDRMADAIKAAPIEPGTQKSEVDVKVVWALG